MATLAPCTSARAPAAVAATDPAAPYRSSSQIASGSTSEMIAASTSAGTSANGRPVCSRGASAAGSFRPSHQASAASTTPPRTTAGSSRAATVGSATVVITSSCTSVARLASTAPASAARREASFRRYLAAITPVVAVPETKPPARPATISPRREPRIRVAA